MADRYEGKASYPNYVMSGVIDGFPEMTTKVGLKDIVKKPQLKGLWTWTRGGGWWGPYIHGNEQWVDLHARVLAKWWNSHQAALAATDDGHGSSAKVKAVLTEEQAFMEVCPGLLPGCTVANGCCATFRNFSLSEWLAYVVWKMYCWMQACALLESIVIVRTIAF
jgi:hypothetical protein